MFGLKESYYQEDLDKGYQPEILEMNRFIWMATGSVSVIFRIFVKKYWKIIHFRKK